jgi:hypothetical protein
LTTKTDFTPEEWDQLLLSLFLIGFFVIFSDPTYLGMLSEFKALFTTMLEQPVLDAARELVSSIVSEIEEKSKNHEGFPGSGNLPKGSPEDEMARMIQEIEDIVVLLESRASAEEASGVKVWLFEVAKAVSEASGEGEYFGLGGERVSRKERYALSKLKFVLMI